MDKCQKCGKPPKVKLCDKRNGYIGCLCRKCLREYKKQQSDFKGNHILLVDFEIEKVEFT